MECIGRIKIEADKRSKKERTWCSIGLITIIIAIVIEISMKNYYILALVVAFGYLLRIRFTLSHKKVFKETSISIQENTGILEFIIKNSIYHHGKISDIKYVIPSGKIMSIKYLQQNGQIIINGAILEEVICSGLIVKTQECSSFDFYLSDHDFNRMIEQFSLETNVITEDSGHENGKS